MILTPTVPDRYDPERLDGETFTLDRYAGRREGATAVGRLHDAPALRPRRRRCLHPTAFRPLPPGATRVPAQLADVDGDIAAETAP